MKVTPRGDFGHRARRDPPIDLRIPQRPRLSATCRVGLGGGRTTGRVYVGNFGAGHLWTAPLESLLAGSEPYTLADLGRTMGPLNSVTLTNPFDMTFDLFGRPVVSDASQNGVAIETDDGATRFIHRFDQLEDPARPSKSTRFPPGSIGSVTSTTSL